MLRGLVSLSSISTSGVVSRQASQFPTRAVLFQSRSMGVFDSLRGKIENKLEERKSTNEQKYFEEISAKWASMEQFTLNDFYTQMKDMAGKAGAEGWRSMVPGVSSQPQIEELKQQLVILEALTPEEKDLGAQKLKWAHKKRVSAVTGQPVSEINRLLRQYETMHFLQKWFRARKLNNLPLPKSNDEVVELAKDCKLFKPPQHLKSQGMTRGGRPGKFRM